MARKIFEMYCNDCDGWILLTLNESLRGNVLVRCPQCGREHPRILQTGEMVEPTFEIKVAGKIKVQLVRGGSESAQEIIVPMRSAYSKTSRLDKLQHRITGGLIGTVELWHQHALAQE